MTNSICLVTAVDVEFKTAIGLLSQTILSIESKFKICRGVIGDRHITVLQCGMGAFGFAEWLQQHLTTNRYEALIVVGLAGGLDPRLKTGDVVIYDSCLNGRGNSLRVRCDSKLVESLLGASWSFEVGQAVKTVHRTDSENAETTQRGKTNLCETSAVAKTSGKHFIHHGAGITVSRIMTDAIDKLLLGKQHQALAVDMESFDVLGVCIQADLPAAVVRVISDEAGCDLPDFNSAYDQDGKMNYWRLAEAMIRRPAASFSFLLNLKSVIHSLRKSLEVVLRA